MKKYFFLVLAVFLVACQDDLNLNNTSFITRAIVDPSRVSISNPDLLDNWENVEIIVMNTIGNFNIQKKVTAPWGDGVSTQLPEDFRKDIKREDGWKMLFHTFKEVGLDEKQNYICFYNMFTGYLKFFYYYEGEQKSQGTQWYMRTSNGQNAKLFNLTDYIAKVDTAKCEHNSVLFSNITGDPTNGITPGWNGFEFEVPYCTDYRDIDFVIGAYDKNITHYDFTGKTESATIGTITSTTEKSSGISSTLASLGGKGAKSCIDNLAKKGTFGTKISGLVSSIPTAGYVSALTKGLNLIFGKTTITTTSDIKLTTTGSITMSGIGASEVTTGIPPLTFNLYRTMNPSTKQASTNSSFVYAANSADTEEHYIGAWTSLTGSHIIHARCTPVYKVQRHIGSYAPAGKVYITGETSTPNIYSIGVNFKRNPDIEQYVINEKVHTEFMRCDTLYGKPYKEGVKDLEGRFIKTNLIYKDQDKCFYEADTTAVISCNGYIPTDRRNCYYDWGLVLEGRGISFLSVETTYSYNGKTITVIQSRIYESGYDFDVAHVEDYIDYNIGNNALLNYKDPAFGIHIEEEDLYLYGK